MWARIWWATSSTGSSTTASPRLGRLPRPPLSPPCPRYCRISAFRPPPARSPTTSASTPLHDGIHDHRHQVLPSGQLDELSLIHISEPTRRTPISYAVFCLK